MLRLLLVAIGVAALFAIGMQSMSRVMNCGGNSAALASMRDISQVVIWELSEAADHSFRFESASKEAQKILSTLSRDRWIRKARFLVSTRRISNDDANYPQLVAVCDTPFTNLPEHRFWTAPPTHAAAYSDGSTRLLTTAEFAGLPKQDLVRLDELFPPAPK